jgi:hypothetical protein
MHRCCGVILNEKYSVGVTKMRAAGLKCRRINGYFGNVSVLPWNVGVFKQSDAHLDGDIGIPLKGANIGCVARGNGHLRTISTAQVDGDAAQTVAAHSRQAAISIVNDHLSICGIMAPHHKDAVGPNSAVAVTYPAYGLDRQPDVTAAAIEQDEVIAQTFVFEKCAQGLTTSAGGPNCHVRGGRFALRIYIASVTLDG